MPLTCSYMDHTVLPANNTMSAFTRKQLTNYWVVSVSVCWQARSNFVVLLFLLQFVVYINCCFNSAKERVSEWLVVLWTNTFNPLISWFVVYALYVIALPCVSWMIFSSTRWIQDVHIHFSFNLGRLYFVDVRGSVVDLTLIVLVNVRIDWDYCNGSILWNRLCTTLMLCER